MRDTFDKQKSPNIREKYGIEAKTLRKKTYSFDDVKNSDNIKYEVEVITINNLRKNKFLNSQYFQNFKKQEVENTKNHNFKIYEDYNIRDLYPIEQHLCNKSDLIKKWFNELNKLILESNIRINRRVTKREIVYKKDKIKSIISLVLSQKGYVKLFISSKVTLIDEEVKFFIIPKGYCKPLERCLIIDNETTFNYAKSHLIKYIDLIMND